jgi:hypothetical protein
MTIIHLQHRLRDGSLSPALGRRLELAGYYLAGSLRNWGGRWRVAQLADVKWMVWLGSFVRRHLYVAHLPFAPSMTARKQALTIQPVAYSGF